MAQKTLYISDLDGTLLNPNARLSQYTKTCLCSMIEQGLSFSVATARSVGTACSILEGVPLPLPVILMNGVLVYDMREQTYLRRCTLAEKTVRALAQGLTRLGITGLIYELENHVMTTYYETLEASFVGAYIKDRLVTEPKRLFLQKPFAQIRSENIIYVTLHGEYAEIAPALKLIGEIPGLNHTCYPDIYAKDRWFLEIFSAEASKRSGALFLKEHYKFSRVIGFGDNLNDLPLFEACDIRVAVANAEEQVKKQADDICLSNQENGVVKWIASHAKIPVI